MQRALDLAKKGLGSVSPNPMVGCVIVHQDKIIGEGWHQKYGEAHAEVNAVNSVLNQSLLREATAYVTLEPCAHHGKTPPCADLLVKHQLKKVVICNRDPFDKVNGAGIAKLKAAGIEVEVGLLNEKGIKLNKRFFKHVETGKPYVILKWAQTKDGFIARKNFDSKWISNQNSRKLVHKWRAEEDAILVGKNTVRYDNPKLDVREWEGQNPLRVLVDRNLELDLKELHIADGSVPTICFNTKRNEIVNNIEFVQVNKDDFFEQVFQNLGKRKIQSIIIEGGSAIHNALIKEKQCDEIRVFVSATKFKEGIVVPSIIGKPLTEENIDGDLLKTFYPY